MHLLKKISYFCEQWVKMASETFQKLVENFRVPSVSLTDFLCQEQSEHFYNLTALLLPYTVVSFLIYPKFSLGQFAQEVFSLLCIYFAIFFWFMDKISHISRYRVVLGVTACAVPIIFLNNSFAVALVSLGFIIFIEFVCAEYMRGCVLFSNKIPVCIVCGDAREAEEVKASLNEGYKILKLVVAEPEEIKKLREKLKRTNFAAFFPFPRRIFYFSEKTDTAALRELVNISSEFSIPFFKLKRNAEDFSVSPLSIRDFDIVDISPHEKSALAETFNGKQVWIFYDGRKSILDLICALSEAANLVVLCESAHLMHDVEEELTQVVTDKIHKIKLADKRLFSAIDPKPDVLFLNMPLLHLEANEDNLKEAVVKNVLGVSEMIEIAQKMKVKFVFMLSAVEAFEAENWIGATQRLGELAVQCAGSRRSQTKFRIVRLPDSITDPGGVFDGIVASMTDGRDFEFPSNNLGAYYTRDEIFHPFIKLICHTLRDSYTLSDIYSIVPENSQKDVTGIIDFARKLFGLRAGEDVQLPTIMPSALSDNLFRMLEKTDIDPAVKRTRSSMSVAKSKEFQSWSIEQICRMSTRDLIAVVFQSLKEKTKSNSIMHRN